LNDALFVVGIDKVRTLVANDRIREHLDSCTTSTLDNQGFMLLDHSKDSVASLSSSQKFLKLHF
jgi:hypothetical protein